MTPKSNPNRNGQCHLSSFENNFITSYKEVQQKSEISQIQKTQKDSNFTRLKMKIKDAKPSKSRRYTNQQENKRQHLARGFNSKTASSNTRKILGTLLSYESFLCNNSSWLLNLKFDTDHKHGKGGNGYVEESPQYRRDLIMYLRQCEIRRQPRSDYLELNQKDLNPTMRSILVDWMVEVAEEYKLHSETLMLSVAYVDRFLSKATLILKRSKLQLVGVTAMLIASKFEEIYAPHVDDFLYITDYTYQREEILSMEWCILDTLLYEMAQPTIYTFLARILKGNHTTLNEEQEALVTSLCAYLAELAMLDYKVSTLFLPSLIASSCVLLSNFILFNEKPLWSWTLHVFSSKHRSTELHECSILIYKRLQKTISNKEDLPAIREKYAASKFRSISKCPDVVKSVRTFGTLPYNFLMAII